MKAMKDFMNKPWTWGTYFKLSGIVAGVYCALLGCVLIWEKWKEHEEAESEKKRKEYFEEAMKKNPIY